MIRAIKSQEELKELIPIIQQANLPVAQAFKLTMQNAPTNPAFITEFFFFEGMELKKHSYFGYFVGEKIVGCIAVQPISDFSYGLERLAVLPEYQQKGYGGLLVKFGEETIKSRGGKKIAIGIIFEHKNLLTWYQKQGFILTGTKKFDHLPFTVGFMEKEL